MRIPIYVMTASLLLAATPVFAAPTVQVTSPTTAKNSECNARWNALSVEDKDRVNYTAFETTCQNDLAVYPEPMMAVTTDARPLAAITGLCRDYTYTQDRNRKNACGSHGGIEMWFAAGT